MMNLQLLRNATQILKINGKTILIDPMFATKGSYDSFLWTSNTNRNPLVDLPITNNQLKSLISEIDAILLTHTHLDHWDITAQELLPKDLVLFCQPSDVDILKKAKFRQVIPIEKELIWNDIKITRTSGHHGRGEVEERMGIVSGYVLNFKDESVYFAGDTIWCTEVEDALKKYHPQKVILNGGAARFIQGDPIVMDIQDILTVCRNAPLSKVYVVHLESVNHSSENRDEIRKAIALENLSFQCFVPEDGALLF